MLVNAFKANAHSIISTQNALASFYNWKIPSHSQKPLECVFVSLSLFNWSAAGKTGCFFTLQGHFIHIGIFWHLWFVALLFPVVCSFFLRVGFPCGSDRICLQCRRPGFDPWVRKFLWRSAWLPMPIFLPGELHGQRSLAGLQRAGLNWVTNTFTFIPLKSIMHPHPCHDAK